MFSYQSNLLAFGGIFVINYRIETK